MTKGRMVVAQLNKDDLGGRARTDPGDGAIARWIVRGEQRFDVRRDEQPFVSFIRDMERTNASGDGMVAYRSDHVFLAELDGGVRNIPVTFQSVTSAHHLLVP